jgi:murein DD-endopeptidase MepM/ murein hydrolase activator NlpD
VFNRIVSTVCIAIKINHNNSIHTVYCHLSKVLVSIGQKIKKVQVVALVGNTGASIGAHLHFGCVRRGGFVEPGRILL